MEIKRSRFITYLRRVNDEQAARELVAELRRTHHTARHHCLAFVCGPRQEIQRSSDDGEPSGTAGAPMLEVLRRFSAPAPLSDVVAVVVRYFGGVKLGAGGLTRAYAQAVTDSLSAVPLVIRHELPTYHLTCSMETFAHVETALRQRVSILATDYAYPDVVVHLATPDAHDDVRARLSSLLGEDAELAAAVPTWTESPLT